MATSCEFQLAWQDESGVREPHSSQFGGSSVNEDGVDRAAHALFIRVQSFFMSVGQIQRQQVRGLTIPISTRTETGNGTCLTCVLHGARYHELGSTTTQSCESCCQRCGLVLWRLLARECKTTDATDTMFSVLGRLEHVDKTTVSYEGKLKA